VLLIVVVIEYLHSQSDLSLLYTFPYIMSSIPSQSYAAAEASSGRHLNQPCSTNPKTESNRGRIAWLENVAEPKRQR
jgi:hypothetical protein